MSVVRLEWVHAKAAAERWNEEVHLLIEESRRIAASFRHEQNRWLRMRELVHADQLADDTPRALRGKLAYMERQAAVYRGLAIRAEQDYDEARLRPA